MATPVRTGIRVRSGEVGDAEQMAAIYTRAAREAWASFIRGVASLETDAADFRDLLRDATTTSFIAERSGVAVGFAVVRVPSGEPIPGAGELEMLYSDPVDWGSGAGRMLNKHAIAHLRAVGCSCTVLWTARLNRRARRFYETAGYHPDGAQRTRAWRGTRFVELRYRLDLTADQRARTPAVAG